MNDDLAALRTVIPQYAGYHDLDAQRLADRQVRAYLGESLIGLRDDGLDAALAARLETLIEHCEFGDQHVIRAIERAELSQPDREATVEAQDRRLIDLAQKAPAIEPSAAAAFIGEIETAFHERNATILALAPDGRR
jgi:hypothetical protein